MSSTSRRRQSERRGEYLQIVYQCPKHINDFVHSVCKGCGINEEILEDTLLRELETAVSEYDYRISKSSITADLAAYDKEKRRLKTRGSALPIFTKMT